MKIAEIIEDLESHVKKYGGEAITEKVNTRDILAALKMLFAGRLKGDKTDG